MKASGRHQPASTQAGMLWRPTRDLIDWLMMRTKRLSGVADHAIVLFDCICFFCGRMVVRYIRVWFALFWQPYHYLYMTSLRSGMHWDGHMYGDGIRITRQVRYSSTHSLETLDVIQPDSPSKTSRTPIVYIHGGAFIAAISELCMHSISFLGREGYTVYSVDYPLAPENKHPAALVSVIKAIAYVRAVYGHNDVVLFGDSAGGSLASTATIYLQSPKLLRELSHTCGEDLTTLLYPKISKLLCLYGILDETSSLKVSFHEEERLRH